MKMFMVGAVLEYTSFTIVSVKLLNRYDYEPVLKYLFKTTKKK